MKTVLISGGTRGIGRACAELFLNNGYNVAVIYKSNDEAAAQLRDKLGIYAVKADVSVSEDVKKAVGAVAERFGSVDVLINNAGISHIGLIQDVSDGDFRRVMDTNLSGAFYMCREVAPMMISAKSGRIINIGSVWGNHGASCEAVYSASKAALRGLTSSLAKELGPSGITVNCVEPGVIETDMNACFDKETLSALANETPLCRLGKTEDVANAVMFLASDKASFITGQFIGVNGGFGQ
ncbi:MAG: 3-oxoacyl-ACP reductase FabG [Clostridia bacterium]|nr:3-oxoacyl-ACP reductase FabG [Clostridia bacterium]